MDKSGYFTRTNMVSLYIFMCYMLDASVCFWTLIKEMAMTERYRKKTFRGNNRNRIPQHPSLNKSL
jgi:hypothetical protein